MSHQCHGDSCHTHGNQGLGGSGSCACGCCGGHTCSCSCHGSKEDSCKDIPGKFLELADSAWMEVLKEKIKDHIRQNDSKLNELAQVISEANREKWKHKKEKFQGCHQYEEKLKNLMSK
jgi:hypothetical protein